MNKMVDLFWKCYRYPALRYLFFGGLTTLVNLVCFYFFRILLGLGLQTANILSIVLAILFAYVVNSRFVFEDRGKSLGDHVLTFFKFIGARGVTMALEIVSVWLLVDVLRLPDMWGKFFTQFAVLVLNYLFSRFFVFPKREAE